MLNGKRGWESGRKCKLYLQEEKCPLLMALNLLFVNNIIDVETIMEKNQALDYQICGGKLCPSCPFLSVFF